MRRSRKPVWAVPSIEGSNPSLSADFRTGAVTLLLFDRNVVTQGQSGYQNPMATQLVLLGGLFLAMACAFGVVVLLDNAVTLIRTRRIAVRRSRARSARQPRLARPDVLASR